MSEEDTMTIYRSTADVPLDLRRDGMRYYAAYKTATRKAELIALGHELVARGYRVTEHTAFGGVTAGAHSRYGAHFIDGALDINYGPRGMSEIEKRALDALAVELRQRGWRVKWGKGVYAHEDHLHVDVTPAYRSEINLFYPDHVAYAPGTGPAEIYRTLWRGMTGADVGRYQRDLAGMSNTWWAGYLGKPDNTYGRRTKAVTLAQQIVAQRRTGAQKWRGRANGVATKAWQAYVQQRAAARKEK